MSSTTQGGQIVLVLIVSCVVIMLPKCTASVERFDNCYRLAWLFCNSSLILAHVSVQLRTFGECVTPTVDDQFAHIGVSNTVPSEKRKEDKDRWT